MAEKTEKIHFHEMLRLTWRGYKVWWEAMPQLILSQASFSIVEGLSPYVGIYLSAQIINELAGNRNPQVLLRLILIALFSALALSLLSGILQRWKWSVQSNSFYCHQKIFGDKLFSLDFEKIDDPHTLDLLRQIDQSRQWSSWGIMKLQYRFEPLVKSLMTIAGAIALTTSLLVLPVKKPALESLNHPLYILLIILLMLLIMYLAPASSNKANSYWIKYADESTLGNRLFGFFGWTMQEHKFALDARIYRQDKIARYFQEKFDNFKPTSSIGRWARGPMGGLNALSGAMSQVFTGVVYLFVCLKALGGAFGVGSVTQYIASITALFGGMSTLLSTFGDFRNNVPFLRKTFEFLDLPNDMYQGSLTIEKRSDKKYEIEFRDVSFKYPGSEIWALRHVTLSFKIGERLAVVGMNGSGKTTFIKLLCRLYDPTEGEILLNGINIRKYDYHEYMSIFSVVFQDFKLLSFSLGQNVAAAVKFDNAKARDCLYEAGFDEKLREMPNGLETALYKDFDEHGVDVSGGEAQKIALARALYKDAAFIILDEPTAALDPVAEFDVYSRMNEIVGDKTAVFISHRLSSCRFCQNIAVFDQGSVIQRGSHEALLADADGKYNELWNAQAQYYTE